MISISGTTSASMNYHLHQSNHDLVGLGHDPHSSLNHVALQHAESMHCQQKSTSSSVSMCSDCYQWHCQLFNIYAQKAAFALPEAKWSLHLMTNFKAQQDQKRSGYWQEILRPPRTYSVF